VKELRAASLKKVEGVHADLHKVILRSIQFAPFEFIITEGLRTKERQAALVKAGASKTMNSRHLTGHAVDLAAIVAGEPSWKFELYYELAEAMRSAAKNLHIPLEWGGAWCRIDDNAVPTQTLVARYVDQCHENRKKPFLDACHFQLPWDIYRA
jgi:peptidoglycan L-alanyl-D-glutamate endopeptidase CwlK